MLGCNQKEHIQSNCPKNNSSEEKGMIASKKDKKEKSDSEVSFVAINGSIKKFNLWIGDTGASTHMTNTIDGLYVLREKETMVQIGNGKKLKSTTVGTLKTIAQQHDRTTVEVKLNNVAYVPELSFNLFSITKAMENGFQISSKGNIISLTKGLKTIKFDKIQKTKTGFVLE